MVALLLAPGPADAAILAQQDDGVIITYTAGSGIANNVQVQVNVTSITIVDLAEGIGITGTGSCVLQGNPNTAVCSGVTVASFSLGDQSDQLRVTGTNSAITMIVNGGSGNDQLTLGDGATSVAGLAASIAYNGDANDATPTTQFALSCGVPDGNAQPIGNTFRVNNPTGAGATYTLDASSYVGPGGEVTLNGVQSIELNTGANADTVTISSTLAASNVVVNTAGGSDQVNVTTTGANSNLSIESGAEDDTLQLRNLATGTRATVRSGAGADTVQVHATATGSVARIGGGDDNDRLRLRNDTNTVLAELLGNLCLDGDGHDLTPSTQVNVSCVTGSVLGPDVPNGDALELFDLDLAEPMSYTLNAASPTRSRSRISGRRRAPGSTETAAPTRFTSRRSPEEAPSSLTAAPTSTR